MKNFLRCDWCGGKNCKNLIWGGSTSQGGRTSRNWIYNLFLVPFLLPHRSVLRSTYCARFFIGVIAPSQASPVFIVVLEYAQVFVLVRLRRKTISVRW